MSQNQNHNAEFRSGGINSRLSQEGFTDEFKDNYIKANAAATNYDPTLIDAECVDADTIRVTWIITDTDSTVTTSLKDTIGDESTFAATLITQVQEIVGITITLAVEEPSDIEIPGKTYVNAEIENK